MSTQEFALRPVDARKALLLPGALLLAVAIGVGVLASHERAAWPGLPIVLAAGGVLALLVQRRRVRLADGRLTVAAGINTHTVAVGDLDPARARVFDLREHTDLKPMLRLFGTGLPGLHMGWFLLRDRRRAFLLVTDRSRVLALPQRAGPILLLSLAQPQALLDALQRGVPDRTGRGRAA